MFKLDLDKAYKDYQEYLNDTAYFNRFGVTTKYTFSQFIQNDIQKYLTIESKEASSDENIQNDSDSNVYTPTR